MCFSCFLFGQEAAIPKNVIREFKHQFKSAEFPTWYVEQKHYEVQFLDDKKEKIAFYAKSDGKLIQTKVLIDENEIPNDVMKALRNEYPDFVLEEYSRIICPDNTVFFSISIRSAKGVYDLVYTAQGSVHSTGPSN